jgi:uncharacterized protein YukE
MAGPGTVKATPEAQTAVNQLATNVTNAISAIKAVQTAGATLNDAATWEDTMAASYRGKCPDWNRNFNNALTALNDLNGQIPHYKANIQDILNQSNQG